MEKKNSISPAELWQLLNTGKKVTVIDVRSKEEYDTQHIPFANHLPVEEIEQGNLSPEAESIIVMACGKGGGRSERAATHIQNTGKNECYFLEGGTIGWLENEKQISHEEMYLPDCSYCRI